MEVSQILKRLALNEETDRPTLKTYLLHCELISPEEHEFDGYNLEDLGLSEAQINLLESFKDNIISNNNDETKMLEQFKAIRKANSKSTVEAVIEMVLSTGKAKETSPDASSKTDQNKKRRSIVQISKDFNVTLSEIDYSLSHLKLETQNSYSHEQSQSIYNSIVEKRTKTPNQTAETTETAQQKTETAQPKAELNLDDLQPLVDEGASQLKEDILAGILQENQAVTRSVISAYRHGVMASLSEPSFVAQVRDAANREKLRINAARPFVAAIGGASGSNEIEAAVEDITPGNNEIEAAVEDITPGNNEIEAAAEEIKPENNNDGL